MPDTLDQNNLRLLLDSAAQPDRLRELFCRALGWDESQEPEHIVRAGPPVGRTLQITPIARAGSLPVLHLGWSGATPPSVLQRRAVYNALSQVAPEHLLCYVTQRGQTVLLVWTSNAQGGRADLRTLTYEQGMPAQITLERLAALAFHSASRDPSRSLPPDLVAARLAVAFDAEAVRQEFFDHYCRTFATAEQAISGIADPKERRVFTQKLFNWLLFRIFLERKGWPAFNADYVRPQLYGELFGADDDLNSAVHVLDPVFAAAISDLCRRFTFTATESTPSDIEVAVDPEMLGTVFEELVTDRHEHGRYYTPRPVVAWMCREALKGYLGACLPDESGDVVARFVDERAASALRCPEAALQALGTVRVCDPACGSGAYLLGMLHEVLALRTELHATHQIDSRNAYHRKLDIIQHNLYGVDRDPFAVAIARLRLWLALAVEFEGDTPPPLPDLRGTMKVGDSLTGPDPSAKARPERDNGHTVGFDWAQEFAGVFAAGGFDIVVANPPYLSTKHGFGKAERAHLARLYQTARGQFDAYALFVERAFMLLRANGCYAYIIPRPVLSNRNMQPARQLMQQHRLLAIADPGKAFAALVETIVMIGQKRHAGDELIRLYDERVFRSGPAPATTTSLQQLVTPVGIWNIAGTTGAPAMGRMRDLSRFGEFFRVIRGVECGKRDAAISRQPAPGLYPLLRGQDIERYGINFRGCYLQRHGDDTKLKPLAWQTAPKLLIRRVANNLVAAVDTTGYHVLNTIYMAIPGPGYRYSLEYACALLNSQLINDYFTHMYLNDDRLFPYVRKEQIEQLPVALPNDAEHADIVRLVRAIQQRGGSAGDPAHLQAIEALVGAIYAAI